MKIGNRQFKAGFWSSLIAFGALVLLLNLGFWQLERAAQKSSLQDQYALRSMQTPLRTLCAQADNSEIIWRKAVVRGKFSDSHTFLLDNQVQNRRPGYFVYSPFELENHNTVLVNRGWVQANPDRSIAPLLDTPAADIEISGTLKSPPATGWLLAEDTDEQLLAGLYRLQKISPGAIGEKYGFKLLPYVLRLDKGSVAGFVRDWREPGYDKQKHLGYAFQWFAMALALLVIFFLVNLEKNKDSGGESLTF